MDWVSGTVVRKGYRDPESIAPTETFVLWGGGERSYCFDRRPYKYCPAVSFTPTFDNLLDILQDTLVNAPRGRHALCF